MKCHQFVLLRVGLLASAVAGSITLFAFRRPIDFGAIREVGDAELELVLGGEDTCYECTDVEGVCVDVDCADGGDGTSYRVVGSGVTGKVCLDTESDEGFHSCDTSEPEVCQTLLVSSNSDCSEEIVLDTTKIDTECFSFYECPGQVPT